MLQRRHLPWILGLALLLPACATAQPRYQSDRWPGYDQGYARGLRVGADDLRRGSPFNFSISADFRRGDFGYNVRFGNRDRYRNEFRRGFEAGYRAGYGDRRAPVFRGGGPGRNVSPPRGRGGFVRADIAVTQGYNDGYDRGFDDGEDGRRFEPRRESRYRSADRGYDRDYGPKEIYKSNYRSGFLRGYEDGYRDGLRRDRRGSGWGLW